MRGVAVGVGGVGVGEEGRIERVQRQAFSPPKKKRKKKKKKKDTFLGVQTVLQLMQSASTNFA